MENNTNTDKKKLENRIKAHENYSQYEINDWIFRIINIGKNESVLDVGCGTGKQLIPIAEKTSGIVIGLDISQESLDFIRNTIKNKYPNVSLILSSIEDMYSKTKQFPKFDLIISCFAIYYSKNPEKTLLELKDLLKDNGRLFLCGPSINNNKALLELHSKVKKLPEMHRGFFENFAIGFLKHNFSKVEVFKFKNPMAFPDAESLTKYWLSYKIGDKSKAEEFKKIAEKAFKRGSFTTVKEVIGVLAHK